MRPAARTVVVLLGILLLLLGGAILVIEVAMPSQAPVPAGPEDDVVELDGGVDVRYRAYGGDTGHRRRILMLHGFASSLETWRRLAPRIDCGSSVALDLPGFGGSDRPEISYDLETQSRLLVCFMDALGIDRVALLGQSMGASLALWTAAHFPDRVSRLVLFSPSGLPGSLQYDGIHGALVRPGPANRVARLIVGLPGVRASLQNSLALQGLTVATSYDERFVDVVRQVEQPSLLVWSEADRRVPFRFADRYVRLLDSARLVRLPPRVAHSGPRYRPDSLASTVCRFLGGAARP